MAYSIRFHRKSRKGCNGCKARHIKCNEGKPQCAACTRRGVECVYVEHANASSSRPATRSPSRPSPSASDPTDSRPMTACFDHQSSSESHYSAKHMLDLRLMHHYNNSTAQFFGGTFSGQVLDAFQERIPQLAFKHEFLMDAILLVSMLHLGCTSPGSLESLPIYFYRDQALRSLRGAVVNISPDTVHAVLGASVLHTTVSFAMDRVTKQPGLWTVNWLTLVLGQRNFRTYTQPSPTHARTLTPSSHEELQIPKNHYGSFSDIPSGSYEATAVDLQHVLAREHERYGDNWASSGVLHEAASQLSRLIATLDSPREEAWLEKKIKAWAFDVVPPEFIELVRQEQPAALIILAYYLAFFQFLPDTWPYQGVASHDLGEIRRVLDPAYKEYLAVPERALQTDDKSVIIQILLSSLPGRDKTGGLGSTLSEIC